MEVAKRRNLGGKKRGIKPKSFEDKLVQVYGFVKRRHFVEVQNTIKELIKPYR